VLNIVFLNIFYLKVKMSNEEYLDFAFLDND
jgi:hypothetical protein